ncbi:LamB/YcsF family protein [Microbacterium esteraromaticum]|uniref:LamB/YcsF family protein n=1 Tax=Microbacterium esteraromaticum TaxID=57043 RepID=UPI001A8F231C|nr:5-oxoprolinase subunit PxpA [Microbacterium esteraromaticum]MBN8424567.1 LamB/YcsF family protein [Microbacterium esteraromaticum]
MPVIDLNSDLGENTAERVVSDDAAMLGIVTSANVSCGVHAGSPEGIRETLAAAVERGVIIGAHPSYDDPDTFGRRPMDLEPAVLQALVERQLVALAAQAADAGGRIAYVKPHGALYNTIARDSGQAGAVVAAVRAVDPRLVLLGLAGGVVLDVASHAGLAVASEAFADRAYLPDGRLVPRTQPGAVLHDAGDVAERMLRFLETGTIRSLDGTDVRIDAQSICVHGDTADAVAMASGIRRRLEVSGVTIAPFAGRGA